jgi:AAA15 family ATPase/GTPase
MKIIRMNINNFRGLENITFEPDKDVNVIVGPNAIGKTTILEAIRLLKALLAPRYFQESQQTLTALGVLAQNHQFFGSQQIDYGALARDIEQDMRITLDVSISADEIEVLRSNI